MKTPTMHMAGPWITEQEVEIVTRVMRDGWYDYDYCERFERDFAAWHGRRFGLMTPNCTSALHLLMLALGLGEGDEVIVPECTWIASTSPLCHTGARPVFCDIDPADWCLSPASAAAALTSRTRAIIAVDLYGNMPQMDALRALAERAGVPLIEDAAEALGAEYRGRRAGSFGLASVFSFHRTKTLTTGEGGMLLTDDEQLYDRCHFLRDHGRSRSRTYWIEEVAWKYMPFNVQAAIGWAQLQRIDELVARKRAILARYRAALSDLPDVQLNPEPPHIVNGAWCATAVFGERYRTSTDRVMEALSSMGLPARPFFFPLSSQPCFDGAERGRATNPVAYDISGRGLNLPSAFSVTDEQIDTYAAALREVLTA